MKVQYSNGVIAEVKGIKVDHFDLPTFDENESTLKRSDVTKKTIEYNLTLINNNTRISLFSRITFDINRFEKYVIRWKRVLFEPNIHYSDSKISELFTSLNHYTSSEEFENEKDLRYFFENKDVSYEAY